MSCVCVSISLNLSLSLDLSHLSLTPLSHTSLSHLSHTPLSVCFAVRETAVLFGDSITQYSFAPQGWGAGLAHAFQRKVDVLNRGYSGYTTRLARAMFDHVFPPTMYQDGTKHLFVTLFFGANDGALTSP